MTAPFLALALISLIAHFIPFERAFLSLDDISRMMASQWSWKFFINEMRNSLDYPLIIFHNLIVMTAGKDPLLRILFVYLSSLLVTWVLYAVLLRLLKERRAAFLGALLYNLIPNKLALYHTLEYTYIHAALTLYLFSFLFFILFFTEEERRFLWASLLCYTVAVFWYLLGFFLPVVFFVYALTENPRKALRSVWPFLIPAALFLMWRSNLLGIAYWEQEPYGIRLDRTFSNLFGMVPNHYFGRQMAKAVLYGFYRFTQIPAHWLLLMVVADLGILAGLWKWLGKRPAPRFPAKIAWLAAASFIALLVPALLTWGVMDRHTSLSSIGFVLLLLWGVSRLKFQRVALVGLAGACLVVSQGTAWSQVVASRINRAIFETIRERKEEVLRADHVLIDQYSFSKRIPYTWINNPNDQMDTYWGVQGLLGRGNPFMVQWAVGQKKTVTVVRSEIKVSDDMYRIYIYNPNSYQLEETAVPWANSVLINYDAVYAGGYRDGNRIKPAGGNAE